MRICVISSTVFPCPPAGYSGLEFLAWQQAKGLAEKGHDVTLIAPDGSTCPGCRVIHTGPPGGWGEDKAYGGFKYKPRDAEGKEGEEVTVPPYWPVLLEYNEGGVILDHSWAKWSAMLKLEGRLKAPILGVCHAPINTMHKTLPPEKVVSFVCISKDQAAHFEALFSPREARVAYNGVDVDGFYKPIEGVKRSGRFLFLARFSTIKGPLLAIEACRQAGVGLDLVGDTSITQEPEYFARCKALCDGTQIRMVGPASRGECVHWFSQAHVLLHPNFPAPDLGHPGFREPFGLAPVEAMACSVPVIAGNYGAMRETISHGETGWLVRSQEELISYVKGAFDPLPHGMRDRCRVWASQFSVQRMIDRYEELCREALDTGGGW